MDSTLSLKRAEFKQALATVAELLDKPTSDVIRDAIIKRFEYSFDVGWKTAKLFLRERFGAEVQAPKTCFRELRRNELISDGDTEACLQMVDDRNAIVHTYGRQMADEIAKKIRGGYADLLQQLTTVVENNG